MGKLMELAAKRAAKKARKAKRRAALKSHRPVKVAEPKPSATIHQDSMLSATLVAAAEAYNAALANARAAGILVKLSVPTYDKRGVENGFAAPVKLGEIVRRYR
jgi:hypothetical protein